MGILSWIILGLIAGAIAKAIHHGPEPGGWIITILLGIAGAFVGGLIGSLIGLGPVNKFSLGNILIATGGAIIILWIYRKFKTRK